MDNEAKKFSEEIAKVCNEFGVEIHFHSLCEDMVSCGIWSERKEKYIHMLEAVGAISIDKKGIAE